MADLEDGILEWVWRQETHKEAMILVQGMIVPGHHRLSSHREDYGVTEMIDCSCNGERVLLSHNGVNKGLMETQ